MFKRLLLCALFLANCHFAFALTVTPTGTEATVEYQEPNTNEDGSALDDLDHTTIYYSVGAESESVVLLKVPASAPVGNGQISRQVVIPALDVPEGAETVVHVWATATDTADNESGESERASVTDRLAPSAPR